MQAYSDPSRESDKWALPDVEIFYVHAGPRKAYDRAYVMDYCESCEGAGCEDCPDAGWYYWYCFPGCLPDSDPIGPFDSEALALAAAQED